MSPAEQVKAITSLLRGRGPPSPPPPPPSLSLTRRKKKRSWEKANELRTRSANGTARLPAGVQARERMKKGRGIIAGAG